MDDKKRKTSNKRWIVYGVIISSIFIASMFIALYVFNIGFGGASYVWADRSSGECEVIEGTYCGKSGTLYLNDDRIDAFCSARFSYDALIEGTISFYFRYDSDVSADVILEFYQGNTLIDELKKTQSSIVSDTWYLVTLKFDCNIDVGEVWLDGHFIMSASFTGSGADYSDNFVIRTDTIGMINVYVSMISIT